MAGEPGEDYNSDKCVLNGGREVYDTRRVAGRNRRPVANDATKGDAPAFEDDKNPALFGRALAIIEQWNDDKAGQLRMYIEKFQSNLHAREAGAEFPKIMTMINEARYDLRMKSVGPLSIAIEQGRPFDYFDEVRKIIERASNDVFFVDP